MSAGDTRLVKQREREREREKEREAMRFLGELAPRRGTTASTSSARARRGRRRPSPPTTDGQLLSLAVQWGVAIEIERAIKKNASF